MKKDPVCTHCKGRRLLPIKEVVNGKLQPVGTHPCVCQGPATGETIITPDVLSKEWMFRTV